MLGVSKTSAMIILLSIFAVAVVLYGIISVLPDPPADLDRNGEPRRRGKTKAAMLPAESPDAALEASIPGIGEDRSTNAESGETVPPEKGDGGPHGER